MKHILLISLVALFVLSCRKDQQLSDGDYLETAQKQLRDSLSATDFNALDFSQAARLRVDSIGFMALRVPFKNSVPQEDFVFVDTDPMGNVKSGKIVSLKGKISEEGDGIIKRKRWDGQISLSSLNRKNVFRSPIVNGFITALHQQTNTRTATQEPQGVTMPEVIIVYVLPRQGGVSWSTSICLQTFTALFGVGGGAYYSSFTGGSGGGSTGDPSSGGSNYGSGSLPTRKSLGTDPVILVDKELQDENAAIDVLKYIKCFSSIPDAGSTCYIEIFSDVPVDSNPNAFFDISTMSPGHTFIKISKSNGTQRVTQNIGFYPKSGYKSMTYAPTAGKLVDNSGHEFNASLFMSITPAQLSTVLLNIQRLSNVNYDVDQYNCTDWALDILNSVRTPKLEIPLYGIPDSPMTQSTRTPQGLYQKLQQMFNANDPDKKNITINIVKGYAGGSSGPCN